MGLKEVLSKLKLVEVSEPASAASESAATAGRKAASGQADSVELEELLRNLPPPKPIDESTLARRRLPKR